MDFAKGQRKDDIAHEHLARFDRGAGALFRQARGRSVGRLSLDTFPACQFGVFALCRLS